MCRRPRWPPSPPRPDWRPAYESTTREWKALRERARRSGTLAFYTQGYAELIPRIRALADNLDIPAETRAAVMRTLDDHERHTATRKAVEDFLAGADRHMDTRGALADAAFDTDTAMAELPDYPDWKREAGRLMEEGEAILSDRKTYGPHLAGIVIGEDRTVRALSHLRDAIRDDDEELALARREALEQHRRAGQWDELRLATDTGDADATAAPAMPDAAADDDARARRLLWQLRRVHDWDGRLAERDRQGKIEADIRTSLERWETLRRDWNRQVKRAEKKDVHVIYTRGYKTLRTALRSMADDDPYLDWRIRSEIGDVLVELDMAEKGRKHVEEHRELIAARLARRREMLDFGSSWDKRAFPDREHYDAWRDGADEGVDAAERVLANRREYGIHMDGMARRGKEPRIGALAGARGAPRGRPAHRGDPGGAAQGRGRADARGAHRPPPRRSREAQGAAPTAHGAARGARGRRTAAQGPLSQHAHVALAASHRRCRQFPAGAAGVPRTGVRSTPGRRRPAPAVARPMQPGRGRVRCGKASRGGGGLRAGRPCGSWCGNPLWRTVARRRRRPHVARRPALGARAGRRPWR